MVFALIQVNFFHLEIMRITQLWEDEVYGGKLRFLMTKLKLFKGHQNYLENTVILSEKRKVHTTTAKEKAKVLFHQVERQIKIVAGYRAAAWNIVWRVLEIHIDRIISAMLVYVAVNEVT